MSRNTKLRLILVDDHPVLREGLSLISGALSDMAVVVAEGSTGEEAFELFLKHEPDVIVLDLQMPGEGGLNTVRRLLKKRPGAKILILTTYDTDEDIYRTMLAGAAGYILKDSPRDELIWAIRTIASGQRYMSQTAGAKLAGADRRP